MTNRRFSRLPLEAEGGFTIIEVMVAIVILLVGLLGSVTMVDTAAKVTSTNKAREGAVNLDRELIDDSRNVDYGTVLTTASLSPKLAALPTVNGTTGSVTNGFTIKRRIGSGRSASGITYTVTATACVIDDPVDGARSTTDATPGLCPTGEQPAAAGSTTTADSNPDDFRKVTIQTTWNVSNKASDCTRGINCVTQTTLVPNPQGSLGPRITPPVDVHQGTQNGTLLAGSGVLEDPNVTALVLTPNSTAADAITWSVDDGQSQGTAAATSGATPATAWNFTWQLGTGCQAGSVQDGAYSVSMQGTLNSLPGNLYVQTVALNRCDASAPTGVLGGRNIRLTTATSPQGADEIEWNSNSERDIVGYRVFRVVGTPDTTIGSGSNPDQLVCGSGVDGTQKLACADNTVTSSASTTERYYVVALDRPTAAQASTTSRTLTCTAYGGSSGVGSSSITLPIDQSSGNSGTYDRYGCPSAILDASTDTTQPSYTGTLSATNQTADSVQLNWTAPTLANYPELTTDPIRYFRIYLDGVNVANRIAKVSGSQTAFVDSNLGTYSSGAHTYFVTAVDQNFEESAPIPATGLAVTVP